MHTSKVIMGNFALGGVVAQEEAKPFEREDSTVNCNKSEKFREMKIKLYRRIDLKNYHKRK